MADSGRTPRDLWPALVLIGLATGLASCGMSADQCMALPCALPLAIQISVTADGGGPVEGVVVNVSGATTGTASCSVGTIASTCFLPGASGTYNLEVSASGFQPARRTVSVAGTTPECGCPTAVTVHLDIALSPNR